MNSSGSSGKGKVTIGGEAFARDGAEGRALDAALGARRRQGG